MLLVLLCASAPRARYIELSNLSNYASSSVRAVVVHFLVTLPIPSAYIYINTIIALQIAIGEIVLFASLLFFREISFCINVEISFPCYMVFIYILYGSYPPMSSSLLCAGRALSS
jgi:hypothetical protein